MLAALPVNKVDLKKEKEIISLMDIESGKPRYEISIPSNQSLLCEFLPNEKRFVTVVVVDNHPILQIWDAESGKEIAKVSLPFTFVWDISVSSDSRLIFLSASKNDQNWIYVASTDNGKEIKSIKTLSRISEIEFSSDGDFFVTGDANGIIQIWDTKTYSEMRAIETFSGRISHLSLSFDQKRIITFGSENTIKFWDIDKGIGLLKIPRVRKFSSFKLSPDDQLIFFTDETDTPQFVYIGLENRNSQEIRKILERKGFVRPLEAKKEE